MTNYFLKLALAVSLATACFGLFAQIPNGYYNDAQGLNGAPLKTALYGIINGHTDLGYDGLYNAYKTTDNIVIGSTNNVYDMYSIKANGTADYYYTHTNGDQCGNYNSEADCYNREHSFPQSWFGSGTPKSDAFQVYPTDGYVNGKRSNFPFGEVSSPTWTSTNGSKLGSCSYPGYSGTVFEPIDEYKGDFARTYFYMATRYETQIAGWETNTAQSDAVLNGTSFPCYETWAINLFIEWHNQDPVSQKEITRNNAIYALQHNRNPFIDHPEYVNAIWGGGNSAPTISNIVQTPQQPSAIQSVSVSATITASGSITSAQLLWGTSSGSLSNVITMTAGASNVYTSAQPIPAQIEGTTVYYQLKATDNSNVVTNSSIFSYTIEGTVTPSSEFFYDDFELANLDKWEPLNVVGTQVWSIDATHGVNNSHCAKMSGYASGNFENEDWLVSDPINLTLASEANLEFYSACNYSGADLMVKIATNYDEVNQPNEANWQTLNGITLSSGTWSWTNSGVIGLNSYLGHNVRLAFVFTSTTTASKTWEIDQVKVYGKSDSDTTAPQVSFIPSNNASNVLVNSPVTISFTESVMTSTGIALTPAYILQNITFKDASQTAVSFSAVINPASTQITLTPVNPLGYKTKYTIAVLPNKFADASGNLLTETTQLEFTTEQMPDVTPPTLNVYPANASTEIPVNTKIMISASEPLFNANGEGITIEDIEGLITVRETDQNGLLVSGTFSVYDNYSNLAFTPTQNLSYLTTYIVSIAQNAVFDSALNAVPALNLSFITANAVDETKPELISSQINSDFRTVTFTFSESLVWQNNDQNTALNFEVSVNGATFEPVSSTDKASISQHTLTLLLDKAITQPSNVYKIKANSISDLAGNILDIDVVSSVFNGTGSDSLPPVFSQGYPLINQIGTNQAVLNIKLNEPGTVFYKIQTKTDAPPSIDAIKNSAQITANVAQTTYQTTFSNLLPASNYTVYFVLQDFHTVPNQSKFISKSSFITQNEPLPVITLQPSSVTVCSGINVTFTVTAQSTTALTYQWLCNNVEITDATNNDLAFTSHDDLANNKYRCRISNASGTILSDEATLNLNALIEAGNDLEVSYSADLELVNLLDLVSAPEGSTIEFIDLDQSGALTGNMFYPSQAGIGTFIIYVSITGACNTDGSSITIKVTDLSSVSPDNIENSVSIYPNPVNNVLNVRWNRSMDVYQIKVLNIAGQDVRTISVNTHNTLEINTFNLPSGFYTVVFEAKHQTKILPFVIVH